MSKNKKNITIDDLWAMQRPGAAALSPDGKWACIALGHYDMKQNEGQSQLWLLSTDGKTQRQLTRGKRDSDPQWSPDGKWIAFVSKRDDASTKDDSKGVPHAAQIHVIAADGGEARRVTEVATGVQSLRWFPDSKRLAFVSWVWPELKTAKDQAQRYKEEHEDKVKATIVENNHYRYWDHWFPRGRKPHIHVADVASGKTRDLFAGSAFHLPPQEPDANLFDISPDGRELAFTFDFNPDPGMPSKTDIVVMDVASGKAKSLTSGTNRAEEGPRYSPDGKWIALLSSDFKLVFNEQARIALIERKSGAITPLSFEWDRGINAALSWAADSQAVYFTAESEVSCPVWRLALNARKPSLIARGPGEGGVAADLRISRDGSTLVYARSSQQHPSILFACNADGTEERRIEQFNAPVLDRLALAKATSVQIKGHGGDAVQMWVITPPDFDPKKKWPLMQVIHGGPHTCWNDTWHWRWNMQLFAAAGYVVAAVNYHGSTGWGQKFISSINGDWGKRELADVEAGTDYMLKTGYIDPDRVVATGGSYGGYMVAYMNGNVKGDRYKAYVCHAGCYDWVAMMGSDGYFWFGHELGAFHWEDADRVMKQSPHHYAKNFKTPTLVIHGELDYRVPYYQGLAYYDTLRVKGVDSRLVFFPDENHWILKPQNSRLWYKEFIGWCDRYVGKKANRKGAKKAVKA